MRIRNGISTTSIVLALAVACSKGQPEASLETQHTAEAAIRQVTVDGTGFHPDQVAATTGQKVTLVFHRVTDATCAKQVVFEDLGIRKDLPLDQDVDVTVTARSPKLGFVCGMGMLRGSVVVQE